MTTNDATPHPALRPRPTSPHLQIYRWRHTMLASILHRATGIALTAGFAMLTIWLIALASGPDAYSQFLGSAESWIGALFFLGMSWSFFYHLCAGIRHLFWDSGKGFDLAVTRRTSMLVIGGSVVLTLLFWIFIFMGRS